MSKFQSKGKPSGGKFAGKKGKAPVVEEAPVVEKPVEKKREKKPSTAPPPLVPKSISTAIALSLALKKCDAAKDYEDLLELFDAHVVPTLMAVLSSPMKDELSEAVGPASCCPDVVELQGFLEEGDVWCLVCDAVTRLLAANRKAAANAGASAGGARRAVAEKRGRETTTDTEDFVVKCFVLMSGQTPPAAAVKGTMALRWQFLKSKRAAFEKSPQYVNSNAGERRKLLSTTILRIFSEKEQKHMFTRFWTELLASELPPALDLHILHTVTDTVIKYLSNPLMLSDFLVSRFNVGGLVAVLALRGLFVLMIDHGLEQPNFFNQLYSLITPDAFSSRHRYELFKLVDLCMKSIRVPAYIAAAFLKRIARVALLSPSPTLYFSLPFIRQLLQRHPNCLQLIHRTSSQAFVSDAILEELANTTAAEKKRGELLVAKLFDGEDPFKMDASLEECDAIHSTLWELTTIERHFLPACPLMVSAFQSPAEDKTPLKFDKTYARLFTAEVTRGEGADESGKKRRITISYQAPSFKFLEDANCPIRL